LANFTAFLDASVLYPAPLRDLLLELAVSDLYRAKWSNAVQDEWFEALLRTRTDLTRDRLQRTRDLMNAHVRDALVSEFEPLIDILDLPDPDDRHVLAAAIKGRADLIVTTNLKDFPAEFLTHQFHLAQPRFLAAVRTVRLRLKNPAKGVGEYLDILRGQGLLGTVAEIQECDQFIGRQACTFIRSALSCKPCQLLGSDLGSLPWGAKLI
jgi:predicted nucleic acid-binding protein